MSSQRSLSRLAATHPFVSLLVGYLFVCVLLAVVVAVQSGVASALPSLLANLVVLTPAAGMSWALGRLVERRAPAGQAWWMTRAQGHVVAFIATVTVALIPMGYVAEAVRRTPEALTMPWEQLVAVLVGGLAFVNALPLVLAFGLEAWGRRRHPDAGPKARRSA